MHLQTQPKDQGISMSRADATWLLLSIAPVVRFAMQLAVQGAYLLGVHLLMAGAPLLRFCCNSGLSKIGRGQA